MQAISSIKHLPENEFPFINTRDSLFILIGSEGITWGCLNGWHNHSNKCLNIGGFKQIFKTESLLFYSLIETPITLIKNNKQM